MKNIIMKVVVGLVCVYFIGTSTDEKVTANEEVVHKIQINMDDIRGDYEKLFDELRKNGTLTEDSEIIDIYTKNNELILNVNESFIYIGGTTREQEVINEIIKIGFKYEGIELVTVLVDGNVSETSEGINLYKLNKFFEIDID